MDFGSRDVIKINGVIYTDICSKNKQCFESLLIILALSLCPYKNDSIALREHKNSMLLNFILATLYSFLMIYRHCCVRERVHLISAHFQSCPWKLWFQEAGPMHWNRGKLNTYSKIKAFSDDGYAIGSTGFGPIREGIWNWKLICQSIKLCGFNNLAFDFGFLKTQKQRLEQCC